MQTSYGYYQHLICPGAEILEDFDARELAGEHEALYGRLKADEDAEREQLMKSALESIRSGSGKGPKKHETPEMFKHLVPCAQIPGCYLVENKPKKSFSGYYPRYTSGYRTRTVTDRYGDDPARQLFSLWKAVVSPPNKWSP